MKERPDWVDRAVVHDGGKADEREKLQAEYREGDGRLDHFSEDYHYFRELFASQPTPLKGDPTFEFIVSQWHGETILGSLSTHAQRLHDGESVNYIHVYTLLQEAKRRLEHGSPDPLD